MSKAIHQGRNVKRFREMLGLKQEGLAYELGEEWSQKRVSLLEQKEVIEQELLEQVARVLKVPAEAIKNFDEETAIYNIQHNYEGSNPHAASVISGTGNYHQCNFTPLDKLIEVMDENKKLYERLLEAEKEKVTLLRELLNQNKQ